MRVFGVLGRALVRWPDARAELRQARVARRFNMMLFGCHASFGQLGQRRGQLEFICDDAAKLPYAATLAPLSIAYIVAKGALEAQGRGGRKGTANFLQRAPIYPPGLILPDLQILSTGPRGSRLFALGIFVRGGYRPNRPLVSGERRRGGISAR